MKKILAFVLASIMVLSLVPASAFAAMGRGCELPHTLDNCESTLVETVPAKCNQVGYQVYECNACGEQFLANFVEKPAHRLTKDNQTKKNKNTNPVCKTETNGKLYVKCADCGYVPAKKDDPTGELNYADGYIVVPYKHNWVYQTGFGCDASYKCSNSGCKHVAYGDDYATVPGHNWEFTKVEKEPEIVDGKLIPGSALYTCKDCKDTKSVQIFVPDCRCYNNQDIYCTKIVSFKDVTCTEDGTLAVYQCKDCNQLYSADKDGKNFQPIDKVEDAVVKADGHTKPVDDNGNPKVTTNGCNVSYKCTVCEKNISEKKHGENDPYVVVNKYSEVDCVNYGYEVYLCNFCGWSDAIFTEPTGHKLETVVVDSTCANFGYVYQYCTNENCSVTVNQTPGAATPNEAVSVYTDKTTGLTYKVAVKNDKGEEVPVRVISLVRTTTLNPNAHDIVLVATQDVTCVQPGLEIYKCKHCNVMSYKTTPATGHEFDKDKTEYQPSDCVNPGYIKEICKKCDLEIVTPIAPTPGAHNFVLVEAAHHCTAATVTNPIQIVGETTYLGREYYACSGCGLAINNKGGLVLVDPAATTTVKTWFDTLKEAEFYHFGNKTTVNGKLEYVEDSVNTNLVYQKDLSVDSTCYTTGYDVYKCSKCNLFVYVTVAKKDHANFKTVEANDATCSKTGNIEYKVCNVCNDMFIIKNGKQVSVTLADITTRPHSATTVKHTVEDCTGTEIATYWRCNHLDSDGEPDCNKLFVDQAATAPYTGITEAVSHKYTTIVAHVAPTCEIDETVGVYYCATCDTYKVVYTTVTYKFTLNIVDGKLVKVYDGSQNKTVNKPDKLTLDQVEALDFNGKSIDVYVGANGVRSAAPVKGCAKFEHGHVEEPNFPVAHNICIDTTVVTREDCSKPSYNHNICNLCGYEFLDNYKPASSKEGHVNKKGQLLKGDCGYLATISDLKCFYCDTTVEVKHNKLGKDIYVPETCTTDGYTYNYCVDCGKKFIVDVKFADADAYHANKKNYVLVGVAADYANKGDSYYACNCCGKQLTKTVKADAKKTGIELVLTADAASYAVGSTIYVTVSLDSYYGAKAWGLEFLVKYNPLVLEFIDEDTTWVTETFTEAHDAAAQTDPVYHPATKDELEHWTYEPNGTVKVVANAKSDVTVKGSQDLVVLAFKVIANVTETEIQIPVYTTAKNPAGQKVLVNCAPSVVTEAGKPVNVFYSEFVFDEFAENFEFDTEAPDLADYDDLAEYEAASNAWFAELNDAIDVYMADQFAAAEAEGEILAIELVKLLDVDGDGKGGNDVTLLDIRALYELIVFDEYMVEADTNFDGIVNFTDLENAYRVSTGRLSVEELAGLLPADFFPGMGAKN